MRLVSLTENVVTGANRLELRQEPPGHLACQIASVYWLPAGPDPMLPTSGGVLEIVANYDRTSLAVNDPLQCAVTVRNNTAYAINMAMVDLGIPPGFTVDPSAFQALQSKRQVEKFEMTGSKILLYLRELPARAPLQFSYMLTPKHPLRVESRPATVYEYYTPGNRAFSQPARLEVR
jgi:hypothetical protein